MPRFATPIPDSIPTDTVCIPIEIPNHPLLIRAFVDAIARLTHTRTYARDDAKTGKILAQLFAEKTVAPAIQKLIVGDYCGEIMSICDQIEPCLADSATITNIINRVSIVETSTDIYHINASTSTVSNNTNIYNTISAPVPNTPEYPDLCRDSLWSGCLSLANAIHEINLDFLQRVSAVSGSNYKKIAGVIDLIPVVGGLLDEILVTDVLNFIGFFADELKIQYEAIVDSALLTETACAIFCDNSDSCSVPTYEDILNYHNSFISGLNLSNTTSSLVDIVSIFLTGTFATDQYYHAMCWFTLWVLLNEERFLDAKGTNALSVAYRIGANSPDNDWTIYCPCYDDGVWCYSFDWLTSAGDAIACSTNGAGTTWSSGIGFFGSGSNADRVAIRIPYTGTLNSITVTFKQTGLAPSVKRIYVGAADCSMTATYYGSTSTESLGSGRYKLYWTQFPMSITNGIIIYLEASGDAYSFEIQSATLSGNGTNPFGSDNC